MAASSIAEFLVARLHGQYKSTPKSCDLVKDAETGTPLLLHKPSNIRIRTDPLQPCCDVSDLMIVFHYTQRDAFLGICRTRELWATLLETCGNVKDTCFGDGVYVTAKAPDDFGSQSEILVNNFSNASDPDTQHRHIQSHLAFAEYCIPLAAPRTCLTNILTESTPQMVHGPGFTRLGIPVRKDRDIWVLRLVDSDGAIKNPVESTDVLLERLRPDNSSATRRAAALHLMDAANLDIGRTVAMLASYLARESHVPEVDAVKVRLAMLRAISSIVGPDNSAARSIFESCQVDDCDIGVRRSAAQIARDWSRHASEHDGDGSTTYGEGKSVWSSSVPSLAQESIRDDSSFAALAKKEIRTVQRSVIFYMYASPLSPLNFMSDVESLSDAIADSNSNVCLNVGVATLASLSNILRLSHVTRLVLHIAACCTHDPIRGVGLVLEDANGGPHIIWHEELETLLSTQGQSKGGRFGIPLLFFHVPGAQELAQIWVESGCRHVMCVSGHVRVSSANEFTQMFYLSLLVGRSVLEAWEMGINKLRFNEDKQMVKDADSFLLFGQRGANEATLQDITDCLPSGLPEVGSKLHDFEDAAAVLRTKRSLPQEIEDFQGRREETNELCSFFNRRGRRVLVVCGPKGIGKSAFGVTFAHIASAPGRIFSCSVAIVKLASCDLDALSTAIEDKLKSLGENLGIPVQPVPARSACSPTQNYSRSASESEGIIRRLHEVANRRNKILLVVDDEAGVSNSSEVRTFLGKLLDTTDMLRILILAHEQVFEDLGNYKITNMPLKGLDFMSAATLFLKYVHRPLYVCDFRPRLQAATSGRDFRPPPRESRSQYLSFLEAVHELKAMQPRQRHQLLGEGIPGLIKAMACQVIGDGPFLHELILKAEETSPQQEAACTRSENPEEKPAEKVVGQVNKTEKRQVSHEKGLALEFCATLCPQPATEPTHVLHPEILEPDASSQKAVAAAEVHANDADEDDDLPLPCI